MKNIFFVCALALVCAFSACTDPDLDPLQIDKIKKGSIISLRGQAVTNLNNTSFLGAIDSFSKSRAVIANEKFDFEADFIAEDITSLASVDVFANLDGKPRAKVATVQGSAFVVPAGGKYPRGAFSIPMPAILTAIGKTQATVDLGYITVTCDLTLKDGSVVPASTIVNSSFYETAFFYPAHRVLCLVTP